ncbi:MAG: hypothetical protein V4584_14140 [Verrucomicrobiota bacterium]
MSNATHDSRNSGDSRRRRSRGGQNRNNNNNERRSGGGDRGERGSRDSRGDNRGHSHSRDKSPRTEEFRPQAPRKYAPPKLTFWQKILKAVGLYKEPAPPSRLERNERAERPERTDRKVESTPFPSGDRAPKSNTRNARTGEGDARPPREPREPREARPPREPRPEGEPRQPKERAPRGDRPRGGDPKSVESTRVYVGNLSYDVTEQDLQELFKGIGGVRNVEIVYNRSTHRSKGYGFVEMLRMDEAIRSVEVLHDQPFMGRKMTVSGAKSKGQDEREDMEGRVDTPPARVVLAPTNPTPAAVAPVEAVAEPVIETVVETIPQAAAEDAPAAVTDLEAKYGFDEPKEKTGDA